MIKLFLENRHSLRRCHHMFANVSPRTFALAATTNSGYRRDKIQRYAVMLAQKRLITSSKKQRKEHKQR